MTTVALDVLDPLAPGGPEPAVSQSLTVALVGNPNCGKTTLFNVLTGMRARTANIAGTTVETRIGKANVDGRSITLIDLPGMYSLSDASPEQQIARQALMGEVPGRQDAGTAPEVALLLLDATNIQRNLLLAGQVIELGIPTVVALNMCDLARRAGIEVDTEALSVELGCPVVPISARTGEGIPELCDALKRRLSSDQTHELPEALSACATCRGCPFRARFDWAEGVDQRCARRPVGDHDPLTAAADRVLTHPVLGVASFIGIMFVMFALIFWVAEYPSSAIQWAFSSLGTLATQVLPAGDLQDLLVDGVIAGVGGVLVFLPQICLLFFFLSLLEDTGYLARAAVVTDRLMRRVGLPGAAFVPLLSAHACAIPAIMASRIIENRRDRLVTILVAPLLTCSARLPVYTMLTALLVPSQPIKAALIFVGAYSLGIAAALLVAMVLNRSILKGKPNPLLIELPTYKAPNLRNALLNMLDRGRVFLVKAGTVILLVSIGLWASVTYPKSAPPPQAVVMQQQATALEASGQNDEAARLYKQALSLTAAHGLSNSFAGRLGHTIEPAIAPLGYDWRIGVGIVSSFAAREVIVSTLSIIHGVGGDGGGEAMLYESMRHAVREDSRPIYTPATSLSLLVFFVLAMQCLPTSIVARRETGSWKWPALQFAYMSVLAYTTAWVTFVAASALVG
jgi:ferrous iron transport protein B